MDRFWHSRCLNNHIEVPDMMRLFAGGTTTPLVVKNGTKQPWVKIENSRDFDRDFALSRGKIWLWLFYKKICVRVPRFYTKKFKSFRWKMKAWRRFSYYHWNLSVSEISIQFELSLVHAGPYGAHARATPSTHHHCRSNPLPSQDIWVLWLI